jgi:uncharacterized repeat protein (TIGR01451 family)
MVLVSCLFTGTALHGQSVFINEFMASNAGILADEAGEYDDWMELYNAGTAPVDIGGMYITDKLSDPAKWQIPATAPTATTIAAGGYLILWFDKEPAQGVLHVNAKLSAGGEAISLFATDGQTQIDGLEFGPQTTDISYGRWPDGSSSFQFFTIPSPGATNNSSTGTDPTEAPGASVPGGFYSVPMTVSLSSPAPGSTIRYTLDGSEPSANSALYGGPLSVAQTTTLRARAFAANHPPSSIFSATYLFEAPHDFPVVALSFEDADFFDPDTGIYPNFAEDWERPVHVELFEPDGLPGFSLDATVEIHGASSAELPQKSLKIKAKANGANQGIPYPVFPNLPFEEYKSFLLRNDGQDWNTTMFRDAFVASLMTDLSDAAGIIQPPKLYMQAFRPSLVFLNGQYWGIHNLREQITTNYIEQHFGLKENDMDFLENNTEARAGDFEEWNALTYFLNNNDFADGEKFSELAAIIDMPEFLDYHLLYILTDNPDWPAYNVRRFRERVPGAKWHYLTYDFDLAFGLLDYQPGGSGWNTGNASNNALARALDGTAFGWPNPNWATLPFRKSMENAGFRRDFINRTADFLNVLFSAARVNARIDEFEALYQPEIPRHYNFWNGGFNPWAANVTILRNFANERPGFMRQQVVDQFTEATGTATVTLQAEPAEGGTIYFSTLTPESSGLPWSGKYFTGVEIPSIAVPAPGYVFSGWSDAGMSNTAASALTLSAGETLTAYFEQGSTAANTIVINEINYNSPGDPNSGDWVELYNPQGSEADISGWVFKDQSGNYFSLPANTILAAHSYLVLVEDAAAFTAVYPYITNFLGDFGGAIHGFKLSNSHELLVLQNAALQVIDYVHYYDETPWPVAADGGGPSLQLINTQLNNALPQSWKAEAPTPGLPNVPIVKQAQTIDFAAIGGKQTTDAPFELTATATSGLPAGFNILSGPATVDSSILTLSGMPGTVTVEAVQTGSLQWNPAPPVVQSFDVTLPPPTEGIDLELSMSADPATVTQFGNASFTATLTNAGNEDAPGVKVHFPKPEGVVFSGGNEYVASTGTYSQSGDQIWTIGTVAAGTMETLTLNFFILENTPLTGYAQVSECGGPDADSSPGNGTCCTPVEDDEAAFLLPLPPPQDQSITFAFIPGKLTTDEPFDISATASSGLPVSLTLVSGPASLSGGTVTLNGTPGAVVIRASQAGNTAYNPAPDVHRTFNVLEPVVPRPDLELTLSVSEPVLPVFQSIFINLTITNAGSAAAEGVVIAAPVPQGLAYVAHTASKGTVNLNEHRWTVGTLVPGESATLTMQLFVLQNTLPLPYFTQIVSATPADEDSTPGNNPGPAPSEDDEALITLEPGGFDTPTLPGEELPGKHPLLPNENPRFITGGHLPGEGGFVLFPQPAGDFVNLGLPQAGDASISISLVDESGRLLKKYRLDEAPNTPFRLDLSHLPAGYYIVCVRAGNREAQALPLVKTRR